MPDLYGQQSVYSKDNSKSQKYKNKSNSDAITCMAYYLYSQQGLSNDFQIPFEATKSHMITFPCLLLILGQHHTWSRGDYNVEIMVPLNLSSSLGILFSVRTRKFL